MIPPVARLDDLLDVLGRLLALDLGDQGDVGAERVEPLGDRRQVVGGGDEGDGEQVDAVLRPRTRPSRGRPPVAAGSAAPPGMFIPLWEERVPPTSTSQSTPSPSGRGPAAGSPRRRGRRAGPRAGRRPRTRRPGSSRGRPRPRRGVRVTCMPVSSSAKSSRSSPIRSFGPGRSPRIATSRPTRSAAARMSAIVRRLALGPGVGEVEAEDVGSGRDQLLEHRRRPSSPGRPWR